MGGGRKGCAGIFGKEIFHVGNKWTFSGGVRWDDRRNYNGSNVRIAIPSGKTTVTNFANRSESAFSPRLSIMRTLSSNMSLSVSGYRAFRAPTLNELYRSFRQ